MRNINKLASVAAIAAGTMFVGLSLPANAAPVGPVGTAKANVASPAEQTCYRGGYYGGSRVYGWRGYGWGGPRVFGWRGGYAGSRVYGWRGGYAGPRVYGWRGYGWGYRRGWWR